MLLFRSKKTGRFEKLLGFSRSHLIVTRGSVSLSCASAPHPSRFFLNLNGRNFIKWSENNLEVNLPQTPSLFQIRSQEVKHFWLFSKLYISLSAQINAKFIKFNRLIRVLLACKRGSWAFLALFANNSVKSTRVSLSHEFIDSTICQISQARKETVVKNSSQK